MSIFIMAGVPAGITILYYAAFKYLPREQFQFIAIIPVFNDRGKIRGRNITWYGAITATACAAAITLFVFLCFSRSISPYKVIFFISAVMIIALPSSKILARIVEKKKGTITIGAAAFLALVLSPVIGFAADQLFNDGREDLFLLITSLGISYALGEGIGRIACISFGCCYGKPVKEYSGLLRRIFHRFNFVFYGKTKKACYAGKHEGKKLVPVQGMTSILYTAASVLSVYLFLSGSVTAAFLCSILISMIWRIVSEFLRADYRGNTRISAYQIMSGVGALYSIALVFFISHPLPLKAEPAAILHVFTKLSFFLPLFAVWTLIFLYTGISTVTTSSIKLKVRKKMI